MPSNAEAAEIFRNIGDLLDVLGERFKPEAYRRAARSIDSLTEDLGRIAARDELDTIPGVGEAIAEKIREYLATGHLAYYDRLKKEVPPGVAEIMRLPGLGPKTARRFWVELGIEGPAELEAAIAAGRLDSVKGFGPRKIELIRDALAAARATPGRSARLPIETAYPLAERIVRALRERSARDRAEIAGSFRRRRETVGDLDILVTSDESEKVFDAFSALPEIGEVKMRGPTKETCVLTNGLQVDLRVVEPKEFGAALLYFTGSKDHNVHLRTIAKDRGLKINEYGIFRGDERLGGATEEEVYAALGLAWVPPELRENRGEVEAAAKGPLPPLVDAPDLRGDLHVHLPPSAGTAEVDRLLADARRRDLAYVGVVIAGFDAEGHPWTLGSPALRRIVALGDGNPRVLPCVETTPEGKVPPTPGGTPEYAIARAGPSEESRGSDGAKGPPVRVVAHLSGDGDAGGRAGLAIARAAKAAIEVGPGTERFDSNWARVARESGTALSVPTGLGAPPDDPLGPIALGFARRSGAGAADVVNAGSPSAREARKRRSTSSR